MVESRSRNAESTRTKFNSIFENVDVIKRRTKIICTVGPACEDAENLVKLMDAGMNVACLNFATADQKSLGETLDKLKDAVKQRPEIDIATAMITTGPEIKSGILRDGKAVKLEAGQALEITTDTAIEGDEMRISCTYKQLPESINIGSSILIDDGKITCEVTEIFENSVRT